MAVLCTSKHTSAEKNYTYIEAQFTNGEYSSSLPNRDAPPAERSRAIQTSYFWHVPAAASNSRTFQSKGLTKSIQYDSQVSLSLPYCYLLLHYFIKMSVVLLRWKPDETSGNCGQDLLQKRGKCWGEYEFLCNFYMTKYSNDEDSGAEGQRAFVWAKKMSICLIYNYEKLFLKFILAP